MDGTEQATNNNLLKKNVKAEQRNMIHQLIFGIQQQRQRTYINEWDSPYFSSLESPYQISFCFYHHRVKIAIFTCERPRKILLKIFPFQAKQIFENQFHHILVQPCRGFYCATMQHSTLPILKRKHKIIILLYVKKGDSCLRAKNKKH